MKTKIIRLVVTTLAIASFSLAQANDSAPKSDATGAATIRELRDELIKTQVELQKARVQIAQLEAQVQTLQSQAKTNVQPRLVPLESK